MLAVHCKQKLQTLFLKERASQDLDCSLHIVAGSRCCAVSLAEVERPHLLELARLQLLEASVLDAQVVQLSRHARHGALQPRVFLGLPSFRRSVLRLRSAKNTFEHHAGSVVRFLMFTIA